MNNHPIRCTCSALAIVGLTALASSVAWAEAPESETKDAPPLVLAQASTPTERTSPANVVAFPAHERGVRQAAAQGDEALRRYVWRTRMIYNFYFNDFVPQE